MKDLILQLGENIGGDLTVDRICLNFFVALVLGIVIFISYRFSHSGAVYSARFNVTLLLLTLITTLIMNVIGNNIALSLGMVGALSIVRFRTAIKDPRDAAYIFWCIAVGISCGVSYYLLAAIGSGLIFLVMLILGLIRDNDRYLLIVRGESRIAGEVEEAVLTRFSGKAVLRVRNQGAEDIEYIYELSRKLLDRGQKQQKIAQVLFGIDGVAHVDLVCQNEEMSR
ncbi:MAG: DUF4956 domain-containing protein [Oscillospiraceae bacterium]|nr:DUF4956 domain-containing protein [Oscillospiraceae bacterium]